MPSASTCISIEERFWSHVDKSGGPDVCWPWTAYCNKLGYGVFGLNGKTVLAHRFAFGPVPEGKIICHSCDNPPCCNELHLWAGTDASNRADMEAKGRQVILRGVDHGKARITEDDVRAIRRRAKENHRLLAGEFGIKRAAINKIVNFRNWRHVI